MRITLLAHTTPSSGISGISIGISKYVYNLAVMLRKMNQNVEMFIRNDYEPKENWIKTVYSPKYSWIPYPTFLGRKIKHKISDIYHADYVTTGAVLINKKKRPSVVSIHDAIPFTYNKGQMSMADSIRLKWYMYNFKKIEKADAITVLSEYSKKQTLIYTNIPEEKIHVAYPGVDFNMYYPRKKHTHKNIRIGYLGGLDGRKNVKLLVESFDRLIEERQDIELHVAGTGKNLSYFIAKNIKNAKFYGRIPDNEVNSFLNSLDIFVFPTLDEGFGLPPLEAMACGVPVLVCNSASMPEVVGNAGILVKPDTEKMVDALNKLVENKKLRTRLSKKGLKMAKEFTWKKCAEDTVKIYESLTSRR